MASYREIVFAVLDEIKSLNGDSTITEEYVIFLANLYRLFLIKQQKLKEGDASLSSANELTVCIDLELVDAIPGLEYCNDEYLRSVLEIPDVLTEDSIKVNLSDLFSIRTAFVSKNRFKYVGHNKYLRNILYCTLGPDNHIYFNSANPQFKYLKKATLTGIFEDAAAAAALSCDESDSKCDILDATFPLDAALIPQMIELLVKELSGMNYRPKDSYNSSSDDLADIANFIRKNMKSLMAKQMTE